MKNKTGKLVVRSTNRGVVSCKYVFKNKLDENDKIVRRKMRLVTRNLNAEFEMKDMRELRYFFSIKIIRDHEVRQLIIDQSIYIRMILERFDMKDCNFVSTSVTGIKLQQASIEDVLVD